MKLLAQGSTALGTEAVTITDTTVDAGDLNILNNYHRIN